MTMMARIEDDRNRQEEIAKHRRKFWAEEILLSSLWDSLRLRDILLETTGKTLHDVVQETMSITEIIFHILLRNRINNKDTIELIVGVAKNW